jgi:hypothetical protein
LGTVPNGTFPEVGSVKGQYWKWVPLLEMGMPFPELVNCTFGYLLHINESRSGIRKRTVLEMGAITGNGNAISRTGKLHVWVLTTQHKLE